MAFRATNRRRSATAQPALSRELGALATPGAMPNDGRRQSLRVRSGRDAELEIEAALDRYARLGEGRFQRAELPTRVLPDGSRLVTGAAAVDYHGTARGGRAVYFDVKVVTGQAVYTHEPKQRHQLDCLAAHRALDACCFLLLRDRDLGVAWLLMEFEPLLRPTLPTREPPAVAIRTVSRVGVRRGQPSVVTHHLPLVPRLSVAEQGIRRRPEWDFLAHALTLDAARRAARAAR